MTHNVKRDQDTLIEQFRSHDTQCQTSWNNLLWYGKHKKSFLAQCNDRSASRRRPRDLTAPHSKAHWRTATSPTPSRCTGRMSRREVPKIIKLVAPVQETGNLTTFSDESSPTLRFFHTKLHRLYHMCILWEFILPWKVSELSNHNIKLCLRWSFFRMQTTTMLWCKHN